MLRSLISKKNSLKKKRESISRLTVKINFKK